MPVTDRKSQPITPARRVAFTVLESVTEGAYASDELREKSRELSSRDAGLAAQIVFGSLRYQGQLDYLIFRYSGRHASDLDLVVRIALRTALFQLRYLERIPRHAAVNESVEWVKAHKRAATGLTNAVLRRVNRDPVEWPDLETRLSCPKWLLERWTSHFGPDIAAGIAAAALVEPLPYVRIPPGRVPPPDLEVEATDVTGAYRLRSPLPLETRLHDVSSQTIVPLLGLEGGNTFLDLCAAPGNKTLQALESDLHLVVAADISPKRIQNVTAAAKRVVLDATQPLPFGASLERVLVDAPCSGTGTLARNPEIKWRLSESDLPRFQIRQKQILRHALAALAPGGTLVYATCSLEREENEVVVAEVLAHASRFALEREVWRLPGRDEGDGFYAAVVTAL